MGTAIGEILPLAVALAAGPLPIIAIMLILVSEDAKAKGVGFVVGRIAGLALIVAAGLVIISLIDDPALGHRSDHPRPAISVARIVIGLLLVALAYRMWRRRNEPPRPSLLTRRIDGLTAKGSVGLGLLVSVVDPASISLGFLTGVDIAAARLPVPTDVIVAAAFIALVDRDDHRAVGGLPRRRTGRAGPSRRRQGMAVVEREGGDDGVVPAHRGDADRPRDP